MNDFTYLGLAPMLAVGLESGGIAIMKHHDYKLDANDDDEQPKAADEEAASIRASMVVHPPPPSSSSSSSRRVKCVESIRGGSGFIVCASTSDGIVTVWDMEEPARELLDAADDDDDRDDDNDDDNDDNDDSSSASSSCSSSQNSGGAVLLRRVKLGTGSNRITCMTAWGSRDDNKRGSRDGDLRGSKRTNAQHNGDERGGAAGEKSKGSRVFSDPPPQVRRGRGRNREDNVISDPSKILKARELIERTKIITRERKEREGGKKRKRGDKRKVR